MKLITTSWDDGHELDFRIADLLTKYNLTGSFYIPRENPEHPVMRESRILELSRHFEIGGHTLHHCILSSSDNTFLTTEIAGSYHWLKDLTGHGPTCFCFPKGVYTRAAIKKVFETGYRVARTTELFSTVMPQPRMLMPTTMQLYEHRFNTYVRHLVKRQKWRRLVEMLVRSSTSDLFQLTHFFLNKTAQRGGCFHLWVHSWEIEEYGLWYKLEEVFKVLKDREDFLCVTNSQTLNSH